ncbi:MAG: helix-turn-helix domain-containing protein [Planctomycetes bacterium]|nr:helix-turn-helix domain-containing protein [Planctomycetota bacterium]
MNQSTLFKDTKPQDENIKHIGHRLYLKFNDGTPPKVALYHHETLVKTVDLSDRAAKKILVVEAVEMGGKKQALAAALGISRQTVHNYIEIKKHFGLEGLIHNYSPARSKSLREQRRQHSNRRSTGNKARQVEQIRKQQREAGDSQLELPVTLEVSADDQPFSEEHSWKSTRYAGAFTYLITLISENNWLQLIMRYFGSGYKLFMVFMLMAACNIRSIEQLKNLRRHEAGLVLGIKAVPSKLRVRRWLHGVSEKEISIDLLKAYFRQQVQAGLVGMWLWFTDGHLLPYTGKEKIHSGYNTQRRMPEAGRTNLVTSDISGRIVDFEIQEGKGDLRGYIVSLSKKWRDELGRIPVMVFDREGYGAGFFHTLVENQICFVTWDKNVDSRKLEAIKPEMFNVSFEFNAKTYRIFEGEKIFSHQLKDGSNNQFALRRIYIWNVTSNRRTCALASVSSDEMSSQDCALAILSRWGASENTFKHLADKHPLHYQPGFEMVESDKQEITNPQYKQKQEILARLKTALNKSYKKFSKSKKVYNKDGSIRKNSVHQRLKQTIENQEAEVSDLKQQIKQTPEKIDISLLEDYSCFKRICNESKNLFDFATSSVWNARKTMVEWLYPYYENKHEYIDLFYAIAHCQGWIKSEKHRVTVRLEPLEQPSRRAAQEQLCRKLTGLGALTPAGKALVVEVGHCPLK